MLLPSILYTIQNNLLFIAITNLDAATYQVTYEFKILTTALFSCLILKKQLDSRHWFALIMLTAGVSMVQVPNMGNNAKLIENQNAFTGLVSVLLAAVLSGFSGVFYEKMIKSGAQPSVLVRNIQLGLPSVVFNLSAVGLNDYKALEEGGFFQGYTALIWFLVFIQAFGGIMVAVVIKYSDNIIKGFASAISIIVSSICSYLILKDLELNEYFVVGAILVILSILIYAGLFKQDQVVKELPEMQESKLIVQQKLQYPTVLSTDRK